MIVPHHVYLMLYDLEREFIELKKEAKRRAEVAIDDASECAWWAAYGCGVGDALDLVKKFADKI